MRMFYTDPLAAAYMAREFGVSYEESDINASALKHNFDGAKPTDWLSPEAYTSIINKWVQKPFRIHADSLPIFEPQMLDAIRVRSGKIYHVAKVDEYDIPYRIVNSQYEPMHPDEIQTIRRNGKPFFWPEIEQ